MENFKEPVPREDLKFLLLKKFKTQDRAAYALNIHDSLLSKILRGLREPTQEHIQKFETIDGFNLNML